MRMETRTQTLPRTLLYKSLPNILRIYRSNLSQVGSLPKDARNNSRTKPNLGCLITCKGKNYNMT